MVKAVNNNSLSDNLDLELRRGLIVLAVLSQLREEQYGYSLKKALTDQGLDVEEGTLYPLLRRLEAQGLLQSSWKVEESRPRRYYQLSPEGLKVYRALAANWQSLVRAMDKLLK
jgi:DNA-binding PadR family transcriptional regulator